MKLNIDFCIIKNPLENSNNNLLIFITNKGSISLDDSTKKDDGYKIVVNALKEMGYLETDSLRFEYIQNENKEDSDRETLFNLLREVGANYSEGLEEVIVENFETLKNGLDLEFINNLIKQSNDEEFDSTIDEAFYKLQTEDVEKAVALESDEVEFRLPKMGDIVDLDMYLFVDLFLMDDTKDFSADLSGSFSKENKNSISGLYKSLIKIFSDSFHRVNFNNNSEVIELMSDKSKGEIYKEISFLYDIVIDVIKAKKFDDRKTVLETDGYYFNILDLKEKINMNEKIYFEVKVEDYRTMLGMSNSIKLEKTNRQQKETIKISEVTEECEEFIESIEENMLIYAAEEEFDEALKLKETTNSIKRKVKSFKEVVSGRNKICIGEFHELLNSDL